MNLNLQQNGTNTAADNCLAPPSGNVLMKTESKTLGAETPIYEEMTEERFLDEYRDPLLKNWQFEPKEFEDVRTILEDW